MTPAIQIQQVHKRFGAVQALAGIDLEVAPGEFFGLLGPNGAGKTTLINILAGLARADLGSARVLGYDVVVGGVSLVTNYRDSFNAEIRASGVDGLIKLLASKNQSLDEQAGAKSK